MPPIPTAITSNSTNVIWKPASWVERFRWEDAFNQIAPVEVEIGAGKGAFLTWAALTQPNLNFLGVERRLDRLRKIEKKIKRFALSNVRLLRLEAGYLVGKLIPDVSVSAYHIYFPDPWPKRRHQNNRLIQPVFVSDLYRTLQPGGAVNVATDSADYFDQIQKSFGRSGLFVEHPPASWPEEARTEFEREFLAAGMPIHRCRWIRL